MFSLSGAHFCILQIYVQEAELLDIECLDKWEAIVPIDPFMCVCLCHLWRAFFLSHSGNWDKYSGLFLKWKALFFLGTYLLFIRLIKKSYANIFRIEKFENSQHIAEFGCSDTFFRYHVLCQNIVFK